MTPIQALANEITRETNEQRSRLERMSDTQLMLAMGYPLSIAVVLAAEHYMVVSELLRRAKEPSFELPDDLFDHPTPSAGSEFVNVRIVE